MGNGPGSNNETVFTMEATPLKYGPGASEEAGWELKRMGVGRVMLVSDPGVVKANITSRPSAAGRASTRPRSRT